MRKAALAALLVLICGAASAEITGMATLPSGSDGQLQYNSGFYFEGVTGSVVAGSTVTVGQIRASTAAFGTTTHVSTFNYLGALSMASGSAITLSGSGGYLTSVSSVNASSFFGDGSHLTGVPSTASISGFYLPLAGGTLTGQLTISVASLTVAGAGGIGATYGITAGSFTVPSGGTIYLNALKTKGIQTGSNPSGASFDGIGFCSGTNCATGDWDITPGLIFQASQDIFTLLNGGNGGFFFKNSGASTQLMALNGSARLTVGIAPAISTISAGSAQFPYSVFASSFGFTGTSGQFVMAATNGFNLRNVANTATMYSFNVGGGQIVIADGSSNTGNIVTQPATGERARGIGLFGDNGQSAWVGGGTTPGDKAQVIYFNGTAYKEALSVPAVAVGVSTMSLMTSGGPVVIGNTAATRTLTIRSNPSQNGGVDGIAVRESDDQYDAVQINGDQTAGRILILSDNVTKIDLRGIAGQPSFINSSDGFGIGTSVPISTLDVVGRGRFSAGLSIGTTVQSTVNGLLIGDIQGTVPSATTLVQFASTTYSAAGTRTDSVALFNNASRFQQEAYSPLASASYLVVVGSGTKVSPLPVAPSQTLWALSIQARDATNASRTAAQFFFNTDAVQEATGVRGTWHLLTSPTGTTGVSEILYANTSGYIVADATNGGRIGIAGRTTAASHSSWLPQTELDVDGNAQFGANNTKSTITVTGAWQGAAGGRFTVAATTFSVGGIVFQSDYTTVTTTANAAGTITTFSTAPIAASMLANNGDILRVYCSGSDIGPNENRNRLLYINSVVISSRPVNVAPTTGVETQWDLWFDIVRTSSNNQMAVCRRGSSNGSCQTIAAGQAVGGKTTFTDSSILNIACGCSSVSQGACVFNAMYIEYLPSKLAP